MKILAGSVGGNSSRLAPSSPRYGPPARSPRGALDRGGSKAYHALNPATILFDFPWAFYPPLSNFSVFLHTRFSGTLPCCVISLSRCYTCLEYLCRSVRLYLPRPASHHMSSFARPIRRPPFVRLVLDRRANLAGTFTSRPSCKLSIAAITEAKTDMSLPSQLQSADISKRDVFRMHGNGIKNGEGYT